MLDISNNSIKNHFDIKKYQTNSLISKNRYRFNKKNSFAISIVIILIIAFLPWTQNINAKGYVTTLLPNQKPQGLQSIISGSIQKWYVQDGQFVKKGDTLLFITEVKNEYLDPDLIDRTKEQVAAKEQSIVSYDDKVNALKNLLQATFKSKNLKLQQINNKLIQGKRKIKIDSIDLIAYENKLNISLNQLNRTKELYQKGLKSLSDLQEKELKQQEIFANFTSQENKLEIQKNYVSNIFVEYASTEQEYIEKLHKIQSDIQSALSSKLDSQSSTSKLKNQLSNYEIRQGMYFITAPTSGYITKTLKKGIGQYIKEGTDILTIMPDIYQLAVEIYVKPQDIPLLHKGNKTKLRFDGWPAIVISGWPEKSTGIFDGQIFAIDQNISENGLYRVVVIPESHLKKWPKDLKIGTGTQNYILLNNVPIWYELWRNLNGFPADYYHQQNYKEVKDKKSKAPLKSVK